MKQFLQNPIFRKVLCGLAAILCCNAYSSSLASQATISSHTVATQSPAQIQKVVSVAASTLSLNITAKDKVLSGDTVTVVLAKSGNKALHKQLTCQINQPATDCTFTQLSPGIYYLSAMGISSDGQQYNGDAVNQPYRLQGGKHYVADVVYAVESSAKTAS